MINNNKLCVMVVIFELYPFTPLLVTLIVFKVTSVSNNSN